MHYGITYRLAAVRLLVLAALWLCWSGSLLAQTYTTLYLFGGAAVPAELWSKARTGIYTGRPSAFRWRTWSAFATARSITTRLSRIRTPSPGHTGPEAGLARSL